MENVVSTEIEQKNPSITIIMAIMNVADEFKKTLDGLDQQEFQSFEVLVADCHSKDDPARFIANRHYPIAHHIQGDEGIYDAWNKVLPYAKGEWVIFMGAGDVFHDATSLRKAAGYLEKLDRQVLMAYGQVDVIGENGQMLKTSGAPWPEILKEIIGMEMFPHQAAFQRRSSFEKHGLFNKKLTVAGDTDMILRLAAIEQPVYFPLVISSFVYGGVSNALKTRDKTVSQHIAVLRAHGYRPRTGWIKFKLFGLRVLRSFLGERAGHLATDAYRRLTGRARRFG